MPDQIRWAVEVGVTVAEHLDFIIQKPADRRNPLEPIDAHEIGVTALVAFAHPVRVIQVDRPARPASLKDELHEGDLLLLGPHMTTLEVRAELQPVFFHHSVDPLNHVLQAHIYPV